jgi:hypothetical protein
MHLLLLSWYRFSRTARRRWLLAAATAVLAGVNLAGAAEFWQQPGPVLTASRWLLGGCLWLLLWLPPAFCWLLSGLVRGWPLRLLCLGLACAGFGAALLLSFGAGALLFLDWVLSRMNLQF